MTEAVEAEDSHNMVAVAVVDIHNPELVAVVVVEGEEHTDADKAVEQEEAEAGVDNTKAVVVAAVAADTLAAEVEAVHIPDLEEDN